MNISLEKVDNNSAVITVKIEKADYQDKVAKALKDIRSKVVMPGFRAGKVPAGLVNKKYGVQAKIEEVDKLLSESVSKYITDNKLNILGNPLPDEKHEPQDIEKQDDFEFRFDVALAPEIKLELTKDDVVDYYDIEVTDDEVEKQVARMAQQSGHNVDVESYEHNDLLRGCLTELGEDNAPKAGGVVVEKASIMPNFFKDEEQKKLFEGAKVGDVITINLEKAYESDTELASLLHIDREQVPAHNGVYTYQIAEISRFVPAEINQELYDRYYEKGTVKSEDEFKAKVREAVKKEFDENSKYKFLIDLKKYVEDKVGELSFPDALLKRILMANNPDKEKVEENYAKSIDALRWSLIKNELAKQLEIKLSEEDLLNTAKDLTRSQFAQYGMTNVPEEYVTQYAQEMLKKQEQVQQLTEHCVEMAIGDKVKDKITLNVKKTSLEDFNKMFA